MDKPLTEEETKCEKQKETSSPAKILSSRLGFCEVCDENLAKYTCPKCEVKSCCLNCVQIHKKEENCDGIREKCKYVPLKNMTEMDFLNDYHFLEECTRYVENRKWDKIKSYTHYNKFPRTPLFKLREAAKERKTRLRYLLDNFDRHKRNTTFYDRKTKVIHWRIEWIFTNAGNILYVDERCCENETIAKLLDKYLNPKYVPIDSNEEVPKRKMLEFYQSKGLGNIKILLKAEGIKKCRNRFYPLDCRLTLKENLSGKTIIEYPSIYVCYEDAVEQFNIIDSDEDIEGEIKEYQNELNEIGKKNFEKAKLEIEEILKVNNTDEKSIYHVSNNTRNEENEEEIQIKRRRKEKEMKRVQFGKESHNFLFSDEKLMDILSSDSETEKDVTTGVEELKQDLKS